MTSVAPNHHQLGKEHAMTAADFRAALATRQLLRYEVAAAVGMNPARLSAMLNEKIPLAPDLAARLQHYLKKVDQERNLTAGAK
jgi:hypothetical protein